MSGSQPAGPEPTPDRADESPGGPTAGNEPPLLPDVSIDESDDGWGEPAEVATDDDHLLRELPPHHLG